MKDPLRDPKGDPFRKQGSGALGDFWPFSPVLKPVGTAGPRIALSLTEPWGPDTCTMWQQETEEAKSRFLMTDLYNAPLVPLLQDRWKGSKLGYMGGKCCLKMIGTIQELVWHTVSFLVRYFGHMINHDLQQASKKIIVICILLDLGFHL